MPVYLGSTELSKAYVGTTSAEKIYIGSTEVWSNFSSSRIDKSGTQTITPLSTNVKVTGWTVNAGYPSTVITDNGILIPAGMNVNYTAVLAVNQAPSTTTTRGRAMNGTTLLQQVAFGISSLSVTITGTFTGTGDVFSLEAFMSSSGTSGRNIVNTNTYILIEKAA